MSNASTVQTDPYTDESVADLIEWLKIGDVDSWQGASRSIYIRYHKWLYKRLYKSLHETGYLEDITIKTIRKAVRHIDKFKEIENEVTDDTRARFEGWLLIIAKRLKYDYLRKCEPSKTQEAEFWERLKIDAEKPVSPTPPPPEVKAAEEALNELSDRDQIVLRTWLEHCPDCDNPQSKLPGKVLQELCDTLGTTKPYIRTLKMRAIARFKQKLQAKGIYK